MPAILSGPSFATDVARGLPTAVTLAAGDETVAAALARALGSAAFRPYHTTDVRGVEIGGAAKNVLAIAAGIVAGRGLGAERRRGADDARLRRAVPLRQGAGRAAGDLTGLSGLGDLILTCSSPQSRNFSLGARARQREGAGGASRRRRRGADRKLAEGAFTAPVLGEMAKAKGIEMPIALRSPTSSAAARASTKRSSCC